MYNLHASRAMAWSARFAIPINQIQELTVEPMEVGLRTITAFATLALLAVCGCSSIGHQDIILIKSSDYGYSPERAIACGGGSEGERKFLSRLRGPAGENVSVTQLPDCCHFRLPAETGNEQGHISRYELRWTGIGEPVIIYLNGFVRAPVRIPDGLAMAE
jgi:hypothetical protein